MQHSLTKTVTIKRGFRGFGFSLIYRGSKQPESIETRRLFDEHQTMETGLFVGRVKPRSTAAGADLKPNDRILRINGLKPKSIDETLNMMKETKHELVLIIQRTEEVEDRVN